MHKAFAKKLNFTMWQANWQFFSNSLSQTIVFKISYFTMINVNIKIKALIEDLYHQKNFI